MNSLLAYVGLAIPLTTGQVLELSVERWLLLNVLSIVLLFRRILQHRRARAFVVPLLLAPALAALMLAVGPSVVFAGTRYPEPQVARAVLTWSFAVPVITGVGSLPILLFFRGRLAQRFLAVAVSTVAVGATLALLQPHPDRLLYRPWSIQLFNPSWAAPQSGRRA